MAVPGRSDVKQVRLGVKGATCPTCAFALRKAFQKLDDVAEAKLTTKPAVMQVKLKKGQWPDIARMQKTIFSAGFEAMADQVDLVLTGSIGRQEGGLYLTVDGMEPAKRIAVVAAEPARGKPVDLDSQVGRTIELEGRWTAAPASGGEGKLAVVAVRSR